MDPGNDQRRSRLHQCDTVRPPRPQQAQRRKLAFSVCTDPAGAILKPCLRFPGTTERPPTPEHSAGCQLTTCILPDCTYDDDDGTTNTGGRSNALARPQVSFPCREIPPGPSSLPRRLQPPCSPAEQGSLSRSGAAVGPRSVAATNPFARASDTTLSEQSQECIMPTNTELCAMQSYRTAMRGGSACQRRTASSTY
jgi:hypothetical protein